MALLFLRARSGVLPVVKLSALAFVLSISTAFAQSIIPDLHTQTTVTLSATGRQIVAIAPPQSNAAVSYNSYQSFGVSTAGATFDNVTAHARLIINEVTGATPSQLLGEIQIEGPRANFILANPNGITVNGARFVNVGNVALATGKVTLTEYQTGAGITQIDPVIQIRGGAIDIGPGGLVGAFNNLDLAAKQLRIAGAINNTYTSPHARLKLVAGDVNVQFDSSISPVDDKSQWGYYAKPQTADEQTANRIAVDITSAGSLTSGRIEIIVTDKGAGVRHAGAVHATAGDFIVQNSGLIHIPGGQVTAEGGALLAANRIVFEQGDQGQGEGGQQPSLSTTNNMQLLAPDIHLRGAKLSAGTETVRGNIVIGDPEAAAKTSLLIEAFETGEALVGSEIKASGGMGLFAATQDILIQASRIEADAGIRIAAKNLHLSGQPSNGDWMGALLDSKFSLLDITVDESLMLSGGAMQGGAGVSLKGQHLITKATGHDAAHPANTPANTIRSNGGSVHAAFASGISLVNTEILARNNLLLDTPGNFEVRSEPGTFQSTLAAVEGALIARIGHNWIGKGALVQGGSEAIVTDDMVTKAYLDGGGVVGKDAIALHIGGNFLNESVDKNNLGIVFSEKGNLHIDVKGDFLNRNARVISNGTLSVNTGGLFVNEALKNQDGVVEQSTNSVRTAYGFLRRRSETRSIDHGALLIPGELAYLVANGDISIHARDFINRGGDINANDGTVSIKAEHHFLNESLRIGKAEFQRTCLIFCRASSHGSVTPVGGNINASKDIRIESGDTLDNLGGNITAINHMTLAAPKITAADVEAIAAIGLYRGLASKFGSNWATLHPYSYGGVYRAATGGITIDGDIVLTGGDLVSAAAVQISGSKKVVRPPSDNRFKLPDLGFIFKIGG